MSGHIIAVDAMGGDNAPDCVFAGAALALQRHPGIQFLFYGDDVRIAPLLAKYPALASVSKICPTAMVIPADMKPSVALRQGRQSSMALAIDAVARGEAACVVSSGNTGALMALAMIILKRLPGIDRPAIASFFPTQRGESVMLDLGANAACDASNLVQFSVMGAAFSSAVLGLTNPTVGLLNLGTEDSKGRDEIKEADGLLRNLPTLPGQYKGFIEGNDIPAGTVDVVVTDGFTGNVALKTAEGTSKLYSHFLRQALQSSFVAKIGYLLARRAFDSLKIRVDPRRYNGAMFLGLQGVCVKSHGGSDAVGFANAIGVAVDLVQNRFNDTLRDRISATSSVSADS
jgi:phosphate acyltransferase